MGHGAWDTVRRDCDMYSHLPVCARRAGALAAVLLFSLSCAASSPAVLRRRARCCIACLAGCAARSLPVVAFPSSQPTSPSRVHSSITTSAPTHVWVEEPHRRVVEGASVAKSVCLAPSNRRDTALAVGHILFPPPIPVARGPRRCSARTHATPKAR